MYQARALHKTQRLVLPANLKLGGVGADRLARLDGQDVLHCLRSGATLDAAELLAAAPPPPAAPAEAAGLGGGTLLLASYETLLLAHDLFEPGRGTQVQPTAARCRTLRSWSAS